VSSGTPDLHKACQDAQRQSPVSFAGFDVQSMRHVTESPVLFSGLCCWPACTTCASKVCVPVRRAFHVPMHLQFYAANSTPQHVLICGICAHTQRTHAHKHANVCRCFQMSTSRDMAEHNNMVRQVVSEKDTLVSISCANLNHLRKPQLWRRSFLLIAITWALCPMH
jgi:hypothetical protein